MHFSQMGIISPNHSLQTIPDGLAHLGTSPWTRPSVLRHVSGVSCWQSPEKPPYVIVQRIKVWRDGRHCPILAQEQGQPLLSLLCSIGRGPVLLENIVGV